jgi:transcription elongation GreA/GreB family factor
MEKQKIQHYILEKLLAQKLELKGAIDKVFESVVNEENSTAGNKYETARAQGQEELDRLHRQAIANDQQIAQLKKIEELTTKDIQFSEVQQGALVKTESKWIYFLMAIGRIRFNDEDVFVLSINSPLGDQMKGKKVGDEIVMAGKTEKIISLH